MFLFNKITILFFAGLFLFGTQVFSYDSSVIHPDLTEAAIILFENQNNNKLTANQKNWIIKGSINEDTTLRWNNHFYNPITGEGLIYGAIKGIPAKEWVYNQSNYTGLSGDYSVNAILENYKNKNYQRAYEGVGHIMHLVEDMAVPAHTRNDPHADGDPFEQWAEQYGKVNIEKANYINVNDLTKVFDDLANFSNNNFFSRDTIDIKNMSKYHIVEEKNDNKLLKYITTNLGGHDYKLCLLDNSSIDPLYWIDEDLKLNLDYWSMLHPKAVGYSSGVLGYFTNEFEKIDSERQEVSLWQKIKNVPSNFIENRKYEFGDALFARVDLAENTWHDVKSSTTKFEQEWEYFAEAYKEAVDDTIQQSAEMIGVASDNIMLAVSANKKKVSAIGEENKNNPPDPLFKRGQTSGQDVAKSLDKGDLRGDEVTVSKIIDGDTIMLSTGEKVRYIGIDTPELGQEGSADDECLAWMARQRNAELLEDGPVVLVKDGGADKDHYGRLLRYVYADGVFVNEQLVREGFAKTFFCQPDWQNCPVATDAARIGAIKTAYVSASNNEIGLHSEVCDLFADIKGETTVLGIEYDLEADLGNVNLAQPIASLPMGFFSGGGDIDPPDTAIVSQPDETTFSAEASFIFSSTEEGIFECKLDNADWQQCAEQQNYSDLNLGQHNLQVRAIDESENIDPTPAQCNWTILMEEVVEKNIEEEINLESDQELEEEVQDELENQNESENEQPGEDEQEEEIQEEGEPGPEENLEQEITAGHIVISEFVTRSSGEANDEFVEIYNSTDAEVDITDWKLQYMSANGSNWSSKVGEGLPSFLMQPYSNYLMAAQDYGSETAPDYRHNANWGFSDNGGHLRIINNLGEEIDKVGYGNAQDPEGEAFVGDLSSGASAERIAATSTPEILIDTDNNNNDFFLQENPNPQSSSVELSEDEEPADISDGLIHLWHFDECEGYIIHDSIGETDLEQNASWSPGKWECSLLQKWGEGSDPFNSDREIYDINTEFNQPINPSSGLTLSYYWRNVNSPASGDGFIYLGNEDHWQIAGLHLRAGAATKLYADGIEKNTGYSISNDSEWHLVTLTYGADNISLYIDAKLKVQQPLSDPLSSSINTLNMQVGNAPIQRDELAIWQRELNAEEIELIYESESPLQPYTAREQQKAPELLHLWHFDEGGTATTTVDAIGNSDLTLNAVWTSGKYGNGIQQASKYAMRENLDENINSKDLSMEFWWRNNSDPKEGRGRIVLQNDAGQYIFGITPSNYKTTFYFNSKNNASIGDIIPNDEQWHHIAMVYDSYDFSLHFYVDGEEKEVRKYMWFDRPISKIEIVGENFAYGLDELAIWEGALSADDISNIHLSGH